jgi:hypothetical protein
MADSSDGKHSAGVVGLAALLGLAGAGRGACRGATVAARETAVLSHTAPMLAREGAIVGAGAHAAANAERAGMTFAREGSHLTTGARAAEGLEQPGSRLAREGAAASEGLGARDIAHEAIGNAGDAFDFGSWLLDDDDDDSDEDAATDAPLRRARTALDGVAEAPVLLAIRPPGAPDANTNRFAALPGVTTPSATTDDPVAVVLAQVRAHRGRGAVVVYGPTASETDAGAMRLTNGYVLRATAMADACRAAAGGCVLLLCSPAIRCDQPDAWRVAARAWAATITAASRSGEALTAARWEREVPALDRGVSMVEGGDGAVRVAWVRRPLR